MHQNEYSRLFRRAFKLSLVKMYYKINIGLKNTVRVLRIDKYGTVGIQKIA
jgi:hypothetical protein